MKTLKLLGIGSTKDNELHKNVISALKFLQIGLKIKWVRDVNEIVSHDINSTPALLFDNKVIIQGKCSSTEELVARLSKLL